MEKFTEIRVTGCGDRDVVIDEPSKINIKTSFGEYRITLSDGNIQITLLGDRLLQIVPRASNMIEVW